MLLAVHLRDELREHYLIELLLPTGAARHLGLEEVSSVRKHAMHVGVAAGYDLPGGPIAEHIEWASSSRPFGHVTVRVRLELGTAKIDVDDVAAIQFWQIIGSCFDYRIPWSASEPADSRMNLELPSTVVCGH